MAKHEFGVIDSPSNNMNFIEYEPTKYDCISIDDEVIFNLIHLFNDLDTYFHNISCKQNGLNYYGITLIPPTSLSILKDKIYRYNISELYNLLNNISIAIKENKFLIHYGI